jgi:ribonuclease P protein component
VDAGDGGPEPRRFPQSRRLTRGSEIRAALNRGKRSRTPHLDVYDSASPASRSRIGLIVPRHGHRIVDRNRLKRRLREILRVEILPCLTSPDSGTDVLVRARRNAYDAAFAELRAELLEWWERRCSRGSSSS